MADCGICGLCTIAKSKSSVAMPLFTAAFFSSVLATSYAIAAANPPPTSNRNKCAAGTSALSPFHDTHPQSESTIAPP
ncbi:hypothetical protein DP44_5665 [Burkholderia pseudomallei]|nr:hypothetical protein DP44_5665 [Burkholderia pseudomallei]